MIAIEVDDSATMATLAVMVGQAGDFTEPLTKILTSALADARAVVESHGTALGEVWAPMHPFTPIVARALYGKERDPGSLLVDTEALAGSLAPGGGGNVLDAGPESGVTGSSLPRAGYQQRGTSRTFHVLQGTGFSFPGIPPRRFLAWRPEKFDEYRGIFAEHLLPGSA